MFMLTIVGTVNRVAKFYNSLGFRLFKYLELPQPIKSSQIRNGIGD